MSEAIGSTENTSRFESLEPIIQNMLESVWHIQAMNYLEDELRLCGEKGGERMTLEQMVHGGVRKSTADLCQLIDDLQAELFALGGTEPGEEVQP